MTTKTTWEIEVDDEERGWIEWGKEVLTKEDAEFAIMRLPREIQGDYRIIEIATTTKREVVK